MFAALFNFCLGLEFNRTCLGKSRAFLGNARKVLGIVVGIPKNDLAVVKI